MDRKTNKGRILVVDDEKHLRKVLRKVLEDEGYAVDIASTGRAAIAKAKKKKYDLIVTDLRLPGISGQETIQKIEAIDPDVKFIIISGYQLDPVLEAKIKQGVYSFFEKPFINQRIVDRIKELLR